MARLPYVNPQHASAEVRGALAELPPLNIFAVLAHADSAFGPYLSLGGALLSQLELDAKLRELAILLVAERTGAEYEWIQHVGIARAVGVCAEQIAAVKHGQLSAPALEDDAQAVLEFTAEILRQPRPSEATFSALRRHLPPRQIVELLLVIGSYHMLARVMTALDVDLDLAIGDAIVQQAERLLPPLREPRSLRSRERPSEVDQRPQECFELTRSRSKPATHPAEARAWPR